MQLSLEGGIGWKAKLCLLSWHWEGFRMNSVLQPGTSRQTMMNWFLYSPTAPLNLHIWNNTRKKKWEPGKMILDSPTLLKTQGKRRKKSRSLCWSLRHNRPSQITWRPIRSVNCSLSEVRSYEQNGKGSRVLVRPPLQRNPFQGEFLPLLLWEACPGFQRLIQGPAP